MFLRWFWTRTIIHFRFLSHRKPQSVTGECTHTPPFWKGCITLVSVFFLLGNYHLFLRKLQSGGCRAGSEVPRLKSKQTFSWINLSYLNYSGRFLPRCYFNIFRFFLKIRIFNFSKQFFIQLTFFFCFTSRNFLPTTHACSRMTVEGKPVMKWDWLQPCRKVRMRGKQSFWQISRSKCKALWVRLDFRDILVWDWNAAKFHRWHD